MRTANAPVVALIIAMIASAGILSATSCGGPQPRSVILITVDTLRADALGSFGGAIVPTPHIDRIAVEGARFERTFAPVPRTTQSVATILTGLHPLSHGADGLGMKLDAGMTTLAEIFGAKGYDTAAFVTNVNLAPGEGFEQGFRIYSNPESRWKSNSADSLTAEALAWIETRDADQPFLLWVHYLDPHWPYTPDDRWRELADPGFVAPYRIDERQARREVSKGQVIYQADQIMEPRMIEHVKRLYLAEVAATDAAIGRLMSRLSELGILDEAILAFTSDHGESMGDHGYWFAHGEYLYDDTLAVPWMIRAPGLIAPGTEIAGVSVLEDVAPTLLGLAGLPIPGDLDGSDLSTTLRGGGGAEIAPRTLVHLTDWRHIHPENPRRPVAGREGRWTAVRDGGSKLIRIPISPDAHEEELYEVATDPLEATNLRDTKPDLAKALRVRLMQAAGSFETRVEQTDAVDDADRTEALRSLGYVN